MNSNIHEIINSIGVLIGLVGLIWVAAVKMTRLEVKMDTIWGMFLKRGVVEGVTNQLMEVHSPIRLVNNSGKLLESMAPELRAHYEKYCKGKSEPEIALSIEKYFGTRLVTEICIPNQLSFGVCLLIATAIAKGTETLTEILDHNLPGKEAID